MVIIFHKGGAKKMNQKTLIESIEAYANKTISLQMLEQFAKNIESYEIFAENINELEKKGVLIPMHSKGKSNKRISLFNKFRIDKTPLKKDFYQLLQEKKFKWSKEISLDKYFKYSEEMFIKDLPYIEKINAYIKKNGIPEGKYIPEVSFALVGDEKWIEEKEGEKILKRLNLWDKIKYADKIDPIAFAINSKKIHEKQQKHLIIENKSPYMHLIKYIRQSKYATVIYGQGWKIVSSILLFKKQYEIDAEHSFYYFGDLDRAGISIFEALKDKIEVYPAKAFYEALFKEKHYLGKENQTCTEENLENFLSYFDKSARYIPKMLAEEKYQPQELLSEEVLKKIMEQK